MTEQEVSEKAVRVLQAVFRGLEEKDKRIAELNAALERLRPVAHRALEAWANQEGFFVEQEARYELRHALAALFPDEELW